MVKKMKKININIVNEVIELSEAFAKSAAIYKSKAFEELRKTKEEYSNFKVVVIRSNKKKSQPKGITLELMRKYAERKNDGFINELNSLVENKTSFFEIKQEFIKKYPQFKNYKTKAEWILAA